MDHQQKKSHVDPVCGMQVKEDGQYNDSYKDKDFYFCSQYCLDKFKADPELYVIAESSDSLGISLGIDNMSVDIDHACCHDEHKQHSHNGKIHQAQTGHDSNDIYTCPMHPEIRQQGQGSCPKCGMALEPEAVPILNTKMQYTCPMHPEILQDEPGSCPKCGMALEPITVTLEEENEELDDMSRRFRYSLIPAFMVFILAMITDLVPQWLPTSLSMKTVQWIEFLLATPVVLWGGWPFFVRGWQSVKTWNLNMFTLIGMGVSVAWGYRLFD